MRFPWANLALLALLLLQFISGYLGFVNGAERKAWILWLHGSGAYAIVLLLLWKGAIIWEVLGRGKRWTQARLSFFVLAVLLLATLILGLLWTFTGPRYFLGFSFVSLHIYVAVPLILLLAYHTWRMRWILRVRQTVERRAFLRAGMIGLVGTTAWWLTGRVKGTRRFTGSYEVGSFSGHFPRVSWINDNPPPLSPDAWRLTVDGHVRQPLILRYEQLAGLEKEELAATLDCTGGFYTTQEWQGISLRQILEMADVRDEGRSVSIISITGYRRRFTLDEAGRYLLATAVAGEPLIHGHGFPLRLVAPDKRGFEWVKWVTHIRVNDTSAQLQPPLPLQ